MKAKIVLCLPFDRLVVEAMSGRYLDSSFSLPCPPGLDIPPEIISPFTSNTLKVNYPTPTCFPPLPFRGSPWFLLSPLIQILIYTFCCCLLFACCCFLQLFIYTVLTTSDLQCRDKNYCFWIHFNLLSAPKTPSLHISVAVL